MSQKKALIVDDNRHNISVLEQLLSLEDFASTFILVQSDDDFMSHIQDLEEIDIIFMDLAFEQVTGFELIDLLRKQAQYKTTPIIAYTVYFSEVAEIYERGFDGVLGKPIDAELFPSQLERIMRGETVTHIP